MISPAPPAATLELAATPDHDRLAQWVGGFELELREFLASRSREIDQILGSPLVPAPMPKLVGKLATGGVVLVTDEGRGISRALAADLRALGNPVFRVRHGVGEGGVEGVNLTSAAAVVALIDRVREIGPIAAIVHAHPLREGSSSTEPALRGLVLLAHAASDDLRKSAEAGGACLIVASPPGDHPFLRTFVNSVGGELPGVRVRRVTMDRDGDTEVQAADMVREVLTLDERKEVVYQEGLRLAPLPVSETVSSCSEVFLLGAPNQRAWTDLAEALIDWIDRNPQLRLVDLAFTLNHGQPAFAFRMGIVATSPADLAAKLRAGIEQRSAASAARFLESSATGRDWFHHLAAERFERGLPVRTDLLYSGRDARVLDLERPTDPAARTAEIGISPASRMAESFLLAMDELMTLQRRMILAVIGCS